MKYDVTKGGYILLGRCGENLARTVEIDVSEYLVEYPGAVVTLLHRRHGESGIYPVAAELRDGCLVWQPTSADTAIVGDGEAEVRVTVNGVLAKSKILSTMVDKSLTGQETDAPEPGMDWVDKITTAIGSVQNMKAEAESVAYGEPATAEYNGKTGTMHFGIPEGRPGRDANVTAANIETALGYAPVTPSALATKQDALTDADRQSITKTGITTGAAWTSAEQKAARERMGIAGFAEMNHITTLVTEEETNVLIVDLGKQCKICRFYYTFPETISTGYTYVEVSNTNTQYYNMSGCAINNKKYLDYIRIASALKPISIFAPAAYIGNESTAKLEYSMPMAYAMDETTGFRYLKFTTYQMKFPKNTTIKVYAA